MRPNPAGQLKKGGVRQKVPLFKGFVGNWGRRATKEAHKLCALRCAKKWVRGEAKVGKFASPVRHVIQRCALCAHVVDRSGNLERLVKRPRLCKGWRGSGLALNVNAKVIVAYRASRLRFRLGL